MTDTKFLNSVAFRPDVYLVQTEAAKLAGVSTSTIRRWANAKTIRSCRAEWGAIRVCREDFTAEARRERAVDQILRGII